MPRIVGSSDVYFFKKEDTAIDWLYSRGRRF
jgi:hypothetical protein